MSIMESVENIQGYDEGITIPLKKLKVDYLDYGIKGVTSTNKVNNLRKMVSELETPSSL
jgi:predicted aldo/keto reductase-like oxidoreductase